MNARDPWPLWESQSTAELPRLRRQSLHELLVALRAQDPVLFDACLPTPEDEPPKQPGAGDPLLGARLEIRHAVEMAMSASPGVDPAERVRLLRESRKLLAQAQAEVGEFDAELAVHLGQDAATVASELGSEPTPRTPEQKRRLVNAVLSDPGDLPLDPGQADRLHAVAMHALHAASEPITGEGKAPGEQTGDQAPDPGGPLAGREERSR